MEATRLPPKQRNAQWKDKLRLRCLERVAEVRGSLLWKMRAGPSAGTATSTADPSNKRKRVTVALGDIISDEVRKARRLSLDACADMDGPWMDVDTDDGLTHLSGEEYEALMLAMEESLHSDLEAQQRSEEEAMLAGMESAEEAAWAARIAEHEREHASCSHTPKDTSSDVICPVCRRHRLAQSKSVIFCACGLRLDTETDQVHLEYLKQRLAEAWQAHADMRCPAPSPQFTVQQRFGLQALYSTCHVCHLFELLL
eukprot:jgi/Chlat1/8886/Chrsp92S08199